MDYSYFPGCTLKNKAKDLDLYARYSAKVLGFNLIEIEDWQCCGGVYPLSTDEIATKLASVRALIKARDEGRKLVTLCSACYNVLKQVNNDIVTNKDFCDKVNNYLAEDGLHYEGETEVLHYLQVLRDEVGWENLKKLVKNPHKGMKIGAYYGCLLLRPSKVLELDDAENPKILEDFISAIGASPILYAQRNECCGAYSMFNKESENKADKRRVQKILANAEDMGADILVTSCPLCKYNLLKNAGDSQVNIIYFSELLAEALGVREEALKEAQKC